MTIIIIIAAIWGVYKLASAASARRADRKRKESARMRREEAERAHRIYELEREQLRQAREQNRQKAEQERLALEQEKQAAVLAKHEERLLRIEQKLELAARDEEHWNDEVTAIRVDMKGLEAYIAYCKSKGLLCKSKEEELRKLSGKLYATETKAIKARQARELYERQMGNAQPAVEEIYLGSAEHVTVVVDEEEAPEIDDQPTTEAADLLPAAEKREAELYDDGYSFLD